MTKTYYFNKMKYKIKDPRNKLLMKYTKRNLKVLVLLKQN